MKLTKKLEEEVMQVYDTWLNSYLTGDIKTYDYYFDDEYRFIGSTGNEEFLNRKDTTKFFEVTADQLAGKTDIRNSNKTIELFGELIFITQLLDAWFLNGNEWAYYGRFRFTSVLRKNDDGWRFIYQHFSTPDLKAVEGETIGYEKISAENLELREAVKRRTIELNEKNRELEIEAALERIRTKSLTMYKTDDLGVVVSVLFEQMQGLSVDMDFASVSIFIFKEGTRNLDQWIQLPDGVASLHVPYFEHPILSDLFDAKESGADYFAKVYTLEEKNSWAAKGFELTDYKNLPLAFKTSVLEAPGYAMSITLAKNSGICIPSFIGAFPSAGDVNILKRAGKVFEQAYIRFLDLQKAEAQTMEAQIEAALEKVRSRSLAMHKSDELSEVIVEVQRKFQELDISMESRVAVVVVFDKNSRNFNQWVASPDFSNIYISTPYFQNPILDDFWAAREGGIDFYSKAYSLDVKNSYFKYFFENSNYENVAGLEAQKKWLFDQNSYSYSPAFEKNSSIGIADFSGKALTESEIEIIKRFAKVFEQAYVRFLDLQKAEAQTREAQINLAVERVRARALAMFKSEEIMEVVAKLKDEVMGLDIPDVVAATIFLKEGKDLIRMWDLSSLEKLDDVYQTPLDITFKLKSKDPHLYVKRVWENPGDYFVEIQDSKGFKRILAWLREYGKNEVAHEVEKFIESTQLKQLYHATKRLNNGKLCIDLLKPPPHEMESILTKMGAAFDLAYKRFEDLQKAEAQAREAQIEAALERVRSRTMAMQRSDELLDVASVLFQQVKALGVPQWNCGFNIWDIGDKEFTYYPGSPDGIISASPCKIPLTEHLVFRRFDESRKKGDELLIYEKQGEEQADHYRYMLSLPVIGDFLRSMLDAGFQLPTFQIDHLANFAYGNLLFITYEHFPEMHDVFKRFARVFEQTYTRFLDLQKAEAQTREARIEAALERTRTQSMIMQHSKELDDTLRVFHEQVQLLGIHSAFSYLWLPDEEKDKHKFWAVWSEDNDGSAIFKSKAIDYTLDRNEPATAKCLVDWKSDVPVHSYALPPGEVENYFVAWKELLDGVEKLKPEHFPGGLYYVEAYMKYGCFGVMIESDLTEAEKKILGRFSVEFERTYTRFLDLQKAEAQGREARIEMALEKVRSRTMAMQHSGELSETATLLFNQIVDLGIQVWSSGFNIWQENDTYFLGYNTGPDGGIGDPLPLPLTEDVFFKTIYDAKKRGEDFFVFESEGESLAQTYRYMDTLPVVGDFMQSIVASGFELPKYQVTHCGFFPQGHLMFITLEPHPEAWDIFKRFTKVFEQTYTRFLDLQKAEAQAREAQIEVALERVRSRSMAMHKSDELKEAGELLWNELGKLGIPSLSSGYVLMDKEEKIGWIYAPNPATGKIAEPIGVLHTETKEMLAVLSGWKKQDPLCIIEMNEEETILHQTFIAERSLHLDGTILRWITAEQLIELSPKRLFLHNFNFKEGYLLIVGGNRLTGEQVELLIRFTKVFQQTYTRFLDLQKAEAQAREAQIEASLERVRSKTMAMHNSNDVGETVATMFNEFEALGIHTNRCGILIFKDADFAEVWTAKSNTEGKETLITGKLQLKEHLLLSSAFDGWYKKQSFHQYILVNDDLVQYYDVINRSEYYPTQFNMQSLPDKEYHSDFYFADGAVFSFTQEPIAEESLKIIKRFAGVFGQTYRRYLDLQKAEAQAREANIEMALEKVRSRTMAMQKSDELTDVAGLLFAQVNALGIKTWTAGFNVWSEDNNSYVDYITSPNGGFIEPYTVHTERAEALRDISDARKSGVEFDVQYVDGEKIKQLYQALTNLGEKQFEIMLEDGVRFPSHQYEHFVFGSKVSLMFITYEPVPEAHDIFKRLGKVFEQTYTRFLDLQKAEAQAREAQIETALEKVRSRSLAMHTSNELNEVVRVVFEKLQELNIEMDSTNIHIYKEGTKDFDLWIATPAQAYSTIFHLPYFNGPFHNDYYSAKEKGLDFVVIDVPFEEKNAYFRFQFEHSDLKHISEDRKKLIIEGKQYSCSIAITKNAAILIHSYSGKLFSEKENEILKRFANVFEQAFTRFLDLQKAEAQAREAKIETALEKIRSRTMAMQKGEELQDVVVLLYKELIALGVTNFVTCGYVEINEQTGRQLTWVTGPGGDSLGLFYLPLTGDATFDERYAAWKEQQTVFHQTVAGEERSKHLEYAITTFNSKEAEEMVLSQFPDPTVFYCFNFSHGYLHLVGGSLLNQEEEALLARFTRVFEQTYARFLDLKKAEGQAREARIEMALEKIRSRTMAMQHSDELPEAANLLFLEVQALGIPAWSAGYNILAENKKSATCWMSSEGILQKPFQLRLWGEASFDEMGDFLRSDKTMLVQELGDNALDKHYAYMKSFPDLKSTFDDIDAKGLSLPTYQINHLCKFTQGFLLFITYEKVPESQDIFKRFTKVFEQTYTRFLDLKKAEARARESQIEASLEKVRSRTMGMQKSDELGDVATVLFKELNLLVDNLWTCGFVLCEKGRAEDEWWLSDENGFIPPFYLPNTSDVTHANIYNAWKNGETYHTEQLEGKELKKHYDWLMNLPVARKIFDNMLAGGFTLPTWQKLHCAFFKTGYLVIITQLPCAEEEIFKRFAQAFDGTYTRFLDLKKSEAQTRQAQIEVALERVRARALAMQQPEELKEVAEVLRQEMGLLGVEELETCSIYINDENAEKAECWYALKDLHSEEKKLVNDHFALNLNDTWVGREMLSFYNSSAKQISIVMAGANRLEWIRYCEANSAPFRGYYGDEIPDRTYHLYKFSHGAIGAASAGDISEESWSLLNRAASVFSLAYSRFKDLTQARLDLQRLKEEKQRAEDALSNLQAAQKQLVQSEKMASLGELTAGIAHEIQNPLNFVNNFSEVSKELLDEMNDELEKGNLDDVRDIMKDVIQNLEKINHHGKRADGIVKGMLQHSRSSSGVKEPTDINALCDEYLRLSYHGLRAKDKSFNAQMKTDFDTSLGKINIISQDIGRVVLNLLTNAFYVVDEKKKIPHPLKGGEEVYEPLVTVSTKRLSSPSGDGGRIEIKVSDNGGGIPQKVLDKIFQPFFTTKPTGQGTGLGLSLSYDIVKAHGGELKVETKEGEGATFIISLPVNNIS